MAKHHPLARSRIWPTRSALVLAVMLATGALCGVCSTVNRSVAPSVTDATRASPLGAVVRAQSGDAASGVTPSALAEGAPSGVVASAPEATTNNENQPPPLGIQPPPPTSATPGPVMDPLSIAIESLFGEASSSDWTPLSFAGLLTEGWNQPFVFSPASDSGALRQEWINAANGVFYRQWVLDYNYRNHVDTTGSRDIGTWSIFAPLSRRLELFVAIPFVDYHRVANSTVSSGPHGNSSNHFAGNLGSSYQASFGDISITPQVLLRETKNTSIMSVLTIRTPTGSLAAGNGDTSLGPQIQFWHGLPNRWVIRGSAGPTVPLSATGLHTTFDTNLTIGRFLTLDEVRYFKEFTVWLAANNSAAMDHRGPAADTMTITPGLRFRLTPTSWFLYGVEVPLVAPRNEDFGMYVRFVKRY
jgi:hypothetical protein